MSNILPVTCLEYFVILTETQEVQSGHGAVPSPFALGSLPRRCTRCAIRERANSRRMAGRVPSRPFAVVCGSHKYLSCLLALNLCHIAVYLLIRLMSHGYCTRRFFVVCFFLIRILFSCCYGGLVLLGVISDGLFGLLGNWL